MKYKLLIVSMMLSMLALQAQAFTVVIDAGHGGHDPGALGEKLMEKDLNLEVSKMLGELIKDNYNDVDVYLTRTTDVFLTLQARADFVNKHDADLFICIHTNAAENRNITGAETFTLGVDKMESNLDVARRENAVMLLEDDYKTTYKGFDPNSVESYIMFELMQDRYIDKSLQFASLVQTEFSETLQRADRGVRQAGFWVLHKSACPSVLVEMGFISNKEEEKYLASEKGKTEIAKAIYDAFVNYRQRLDHKTPQVQSTVNNVIQANTKQKPQLKTKTDSDVKQTKKVNATVQEEPKTQEEKKIEARAEQIQEDSIDNGSSSKVLKPVFRIQIFSTTKILQEGDPTFRGLKGCKYTLDGKYYKYTYGEDNDYQTICDIRDGLREKFKDCFIVAFLGDEQIFVKDALKMITETK